MARHVNPILTFGQFHANGVVLVYQNHATLQIFISTELKGKYICQKGTKKEEDKTRRKEQMKILILIQFKGE